MLCIMKGEFTAMEVEGLQRGHGETLKIQDGTSCDNSLSFR